MILMLLIFLASVAALCAAVLHPGWLDIVLLAGPCALGSLVLLVRAVSRSRLAQPKPSGPWRAATRPRRWFFFRRAPPNWIVVDGSNVMHWKDGTPQIETVREVLDRLTALGFSPGVVFDANAGYKIAGRYRHDHAFGKLLGLPESRVLVVAKGTPADPILLAAARDLGARIVTNDRYRDWAETHPEVREAGHLIRGGYRDGALWLEVG
jgi:hypothetical protein